MPPGQNAGYAGIQLQFDTGSGCQTQYTHLGMFGIVGRFASAAFVGGGSFPANFVGARGWFQHVMPSTQQGVLRMLIYTGYNDEVYDACYSMNEMVIVP